MDRQRVFDRVRAHLLSQMREARAYDGNCVYRTVEDGKTLRCAVGCLIPDEAYSQGIERVGVRALFEENRTRSRQTAARAIEADFGKVGEEDVLFLGDLQMVHDDWQPRSWDRRLRKVAEDWGLEVRG